MNGAQIHLWLNHTPIFGVLIGLLILLFAVYKKSEELKRAGLGLFLATALIAIPTYLTGEPAEEVVETLPGVEASFIEAHEEWALAALIAVEVLGLAALAGLLFSRKPGRYSTMAIRGCVILAILAFGIVAWTAHLGGQIRHPETRAGFPAEVGEED